MSTTKYLIRQLAEAEHESEEALAASRKAAERSNAAFDRLLNAQKDLAAHLRERKEKAKEEVATKPTKSGVPV